MKPAVIFVAIIGIVAVACEDRVIGESQKLARQLAAAEVTRVSDKSAPPAGGAIRLILDASESMAGFVGCQGTPTRFDLVLDRLGPSLGVHEVWLFGSSPTPGVPLVDARPLGHELHCPSSYRRLGNPDSAVVAELTKDPKTAVAVYLTDGVQSDAHEATPAPFVMALRNWLTKGGSLAVIAFHSRFSGRAWSERLGRMIGNVSVSARPFYAFVLARSEGDLDRTLKQIPPVLMDGTTLIRLGPKPPECAVRPAKLIVAKLVESDWAWVMLPTSVASKMADQPVEIGGFACRMPEAHPLAGVLAQVEPYRFQTWHSQDFGPAEDLPTGTLFAGSKVKAGPGLSTVALEGQTPPSPSHNYGFYALRVRAVPGHLRADIDSLSTDDDGSPQMFNRTYRFNWLIEDLVRDQFQRAPIQRPYFLTIQYR